MPANNSINYIEFPLKNSDATIDFYSRAFGWTFTRWGDDYLSFEGAGIDGGFNGAGTAGITTPGVLVVLYSSDLAKTEQAVSDAGGTLTQATYDFPGGRRFHFKDPNGNELAVWSEK
ncbi:VOC family protein [Emcibacter sp.]|uniref:VOC family protein n=1 Tax=Emcibacter sp. TaxID=1979954 RepID=UPI002AA6E01B|nr:VOC family protein [Emcibacter sp.]